MAALLKKYLSFFWLILFALSLSFLFTKTPLARHLYARNADFLLNYRYRHASKPKIIDQIIIIDIEDTTLSRLKQRWPISRDNYARALKNLSIAGLRPTAVAIEIAFLGKSENPEIDTLLALAMKETPNIVLGTYLDAQGKMVMPEAAFREPVKAVGFVNYPRDEDFIIRRVRPYSVFAGKTEYAMTLELAGILKYWDLQKATYNPKTAVLKINSLSRPQNNIELRLDKKTRTTRINYLAKFSDFKIIPFWKVSEGIEPAESFKNKIVVIGTAMELLHDMHITPLGLMPGLAINANFLTSLLLDRFLFELPARAYLFLFFIAALLICLAVSRYGNLKTLLLCMSVSALAMLFSLLLIQKDILFNFFGLSAVAFLSLASMACLKYVKVVIESQRLNNLALSDPLTGLYLARYFELKLNSEVRFALNAKKDVSLVIFEIADFAKINETYGYDLGDEVLISVAQAVKRNSRPTDTCCRVEGAKIAVILAHTSIENAKKYMDKIRKIVSGLKFSRPLLELNLTANLSSLAGISTKTPEELMKSTLPLK